MMFFSELYGVYYQAVAEILRAAVEHPVSEAELREIVEKYAFEESILSIPSALQEERWQLLKSDGTTPLKHSPNMPLTTLQKRWLKAIGMDPRIRLFTGDILEFPEVEPLFYPEDLLIFDRYSDGDDYESESYQKNFRQVLDAIRNRYPLRIEQKNRRGEIIQILIFPESLEYSEKDDKFRVIGKGSYFGNTVNIGRILSCSPYEGGGGFALERRNAPRPRSVKFELTDQRNALERVLMHFAHFEKQAERLGEDKYLITVFYDKEDETELVIRILSFGPRLKVTEPVHFVNLIKRRLIEQKSCGQ
ncbi:MAG: WYL domain-containing protein [Eubacteriales bacterium]|nr:WYL domain-containing protein [Eubacteriales bacterium]